MADKRLEDMSVDEMFAEMEKLSTAFKESGSDSYPSEPEDLIGSRIAKNESDIGAQEIKNRSEILNILKGLHQFQNMDRDDEIKLAEAVAKITGIKASARNSNAMAAKREKELAGDVPDMTEYKYMLEYIDSMEDEFWPIRAILTRHNVKPKGLEPNELGMFNADLRNFKARPEHIKSYIAPLQSMFEKTLHQAWAIATPEEKELLPRVAKANDRTAEATPEEEQLVQHIEGLARGEDAEGKPEGDAAYEYRKLDTIAHSISDLVNQNRYRQFTPDESKYLNEVVMPAFESHDARTIDRLMRDDKFKATGLFNGRVVAAVAAIANNLLNLRKKEDVAGVAKDIKDIYGENVPRGLGNRMASIETDPDMSHDDRYKAYQKLYNRHSGKAHTGKMYGADDVVTDSITQKIANIRSILNG